MGLKLPRSTVAKDVSKVIPVIGGAISCGLNFVSMMPMANSFVRFFIYVFNLLCIILSFAFIGSVKNRTILIRREGMVLSEFAGKMIWG